MKGFFLNKQSLLKSLVQKLSEDVSEDPSQLAPWYLRVSKHQEEKSVRLHQEQVERYHKIHDLYAIKSRYGKHRSTGGDEPTKRLFVLEDDSTTFTDTYQSTVQTAH